MENPYIIVPGIPGELRQSRADWLKLADTFNGIADKLEPHGMVTGYHNHHAEFSPMDGEIQWDTFFGNTNEGVVMQLDMGNALSGGADLVGILERYPGRAGTVHLKPYTESLGEVTDTPVSVPSSVRTACRGVRFSESVKPPAARNGISLNMKAMPSRRLRLLNAA